MTKQAKKTLAEAVEVTRYSFGATAIADLRDKKQLSWARVADELKLGSPGTARRAYSELVRPHTESVLESKPSGRKPGAGKAGNGGNGFELVDISECTTLAAIRKAIGGFDVQVQPIRSNGQVRVLGARKVAKLNMEAKGGPAVDLVGTDGTPRTVRLDKVSGRRPAQ